MRSRTVRAVRYVKDPRATAGQPSGAALALLRVLQDL